MDNKEKEKVIVEKELNKSNWMVTQTYTIIKTDTWLIEDETKEDAIYIAENQNQSKRYKCMKWDKTESDPEFDDEVIIKEVSFEKDEKGKYDWVKKEKEKDKQIVIKDHQYEINADGTETDTERYGKGDVNGKK